MLHSFLNADVPCERFGIILEMAGFFVAPKLCKEMANIIRSSKSLELVTSVLRHCKRSSHDSGSKPLNTLTGKTVTVDCSSLDTFYGSSDMFNRLVARSRFIPQDIQVHILTIRYSVPPSTHQSDAAMDTPARSIVSLTQVEQMTTSHVCLMQIRLYVS